MNRETIDFIKTLKKYKLTRQQFKSLKGQAISGHLELAKKGLETATEKSPEAYISDMTDLLDYVRVNGLEDSETFKEAIKCITKHN